MSMAVPSPAAVLYLATWLPAELHAEFSAWCDDHHREQLSLPGFVRARRFEWVKSFRDDAPPQFLTMYDLNSLDALRTDAYREHMATSPGLPDAFRGRLRLERQECTVLAAHPHSWWPPTSTPLLDVFQISDDALAIELGQHITELRSAPTPGVCLRLIDSAEHEPLVLIDHEPETHHLIDSLTAATGSLRSSWRTCFDESAPQ